MATPVSASVFSQCHFPNGYSGVWFLQNTDELALMKVFWAAECSAKSGKERTSFPYKHACTHKQGIPGRHAPPHHPHTHARTLARVHYTSHTHTHTHTDARTPLHTHTHAHARTHARTHLARTRQVRLIQLSMLCLLPAFLLIHPSSFFFLLSSCS